MVVYGFKENRCKQEVPSKTEFSTLNTKVKITTYSNFSDVPGCSESTYMRTVAQKMAVPSVLTCFQSDSKFPGDGNGILTVIKNYDDRATFLFFSTGGTYIKNFLSADPEAWAQTAFSWDQLATEAETSAIINEIKNYAQKTYVDEKLLRLDADLQSLSTRISNCCTSDEVDAKISQAIMNYDAGKS